MPSKRNVAAAALKPPSVGKMKRTVFCSYWKTTSGWTLVPNWQMPSTPMSRQFLVFVGGRRTRSARSSRPH